MSHTLTEVLNIAYSLSVANGIDKCGGLKLSQCDSRHMLRILRHTWIWIICQNMWWYCYESMSCYHVFCYSNSISPHLTFLANWIGKNSGLKLLLWDSWQIENSHEHPEAADLCFIIVLTLKCVLGLWYLVHHKFSTNKWFEAVAAS